MSKTVLLFAETERTLNQILKRLTTQDVITVIICTDNGIECKSFPPFNVETKFFADFISEGLDKAVLGRAEEFIRELFEKNPPLREELDRGGLQLSETINFPFVTLAQHPFRAALTMEKMVRAIPADRVVTDAHWFQIARLAELKGVECLEDNPPSGGYFFLKALRRYLYMLAWTLGGLGHRLIMPVLSAWFLHRFYLKGSFPAKVYLIGGPYHNKAFYPVWRKLLAREIKALELFPFTLSLLKSTRRLPWPWGILEGLAGPKDLGRWIARYLRVAYKYFKVKIPEPVGGSDLIPGGFLQAFDRFFLLNVPVAIIYGDLGRKLRASNGLRSIIFSLPNSWANAAMSLAIKGCPINIVSITHGMVLNPLAYRSGNSMKISWSSFDSRLLSEYSRDDHYLSLGNTVSGLEQLDSPATGALADLEKDLVWIGGRQGGGRPDKPLGTFVAILPSSDIVGANLLNFMDASLQYFLKEKEKYQFDSVLVKIHPRTSLRGYERLLSIYARDHQGLPPICLSRTTRFNGILKHCVFAVCSMSTIMLDLLRQGVPFSVYHRGPYHDQTFINLFPEWMRFKTVQDLARITTEDLHGFAELSQKLSNCYWHSEDNDIKNLEELIDIILSRRVIPTDEKGNLNTHRVF